MKCPKCHFENPPETRFCGNCGTDFQPSEKIPFSPTKTLQTPKKELTIGSIFAGRYQVIEELGKGGMGKVYKVLDKEIAEKIALKLLNPEIAADEETIERFRNELKLARKISHRNVCRMYDINKEEGVLYITMEYVPGEDLKSLIRRIGQFTVGKATFIARQVCEGLAEAHRVGVVHRDLKPQNIMIDRDGNSRIMDFGIARSIKAKGITGVGVIIGTPEYMSPEQVEGKEVDQRSDIYALGVILYEMLTGRVPFEGETPLSVALKQKTEAPRDPKELNTQIPEDLSRLMLRCMEKDKEKRYKGAEEVLSELGKIERGIPTTERIVPARKPLTSREITVQFSLKKLFIPALVFIALVVAGVLIWRFIPHKEEVRRSIAVISFENQTGDKAYDYLQKAIPNLLITSLEQSKYLRVTTWERMNDILKQMGKGEVEIIDKDLGFELCRRDSIEAIVLGSYIKAGETFATDVKVLDVGSKRLLKSTSSKGEGVSSILKKQIDELSREISRGVGLAERKAEAPQPRIAEVTTSSMDAYNYFLRGREDYEKFYYADARKFLEKAVEVDPTFAVAYLYLAWTLGELGEIKARDEAYEKAKNYSEKATEKERLFIEARYASTIERNQEKRFRILNEMAQKYPEEKRLHYELGLYYQGRFLFNEAIEEYNRGLKLDPNYGSIINQLAYTYADMGIYDKAIDYFQKYASLSPGDANPIDSMAELYLKMGRLDEAIAKYKEALDVKPDFGAEWKIAYIYALKEDYQEAMKWIDQFLAAAQSPGIKTEAYIWKGFFSYWLGSLDRSLSELSRVADLAEALGNKFLEARTEFLRGWIYYDRGELDPGRKCYESWFDYHKKYNPQDIAVFTIDYNFYLGLVDLKRGQIESGKSKLAEIKSLLPKINPAYKEWITHEYELFLREALLAEGSPEKVIAFLQKPSPTVIPGMLTNYMLSYNTPFLRDVLARAYKEKGEIDKAISEYERLLTINPENQDRQLFHPKYHYRLARLYEEKGNSIKAIEQYEKFLEIWKNADEGLPEVSDARARVAKLKGTSKKS
jgi:tetratricopeptide (TPR) repeat protein/tRNA A-37 threonylcarbamoyl transferase component Bud32